MDILYELIVLQCNPNGAEEGLCRQLLLHAAGLVAASTSTSTSTSRPRTSFAKMPMIFCPRKQHSAGQIHAGAAFT